LDIPTQDFNEVLLMTIILKEIHYSCMVCIAVTNIALPKVTYQQLLIKMISCKFVRLSNTLMTV